MPSPALILCRTFTPAAFAGQNGCTSCRPSACCACCASSTFLRQVAGGPETLHTVNLQQQMRAHVNLLPVHLPRPSLPLLCPLCSSLSWSKFAGLLAALAPSTPPHKGLPIAAACVHGLCCWCPTLMPTANLLAHLLDHCSGSARC